MNPDEIAKAGTPETAWITPDGKFITTDAAEAKANGATHQVSAANVTFADGRKQWIVYSGADRSHAPGTFSPAGPPLGIDATQQRIYQQGQTSASKPPDERNNNGRRERWNPATGAWEDVGAAINTTAPATAGTEVTRAAEAKAKREREESEANAALPPDQDPRYETNEARAKRAQETIKQQGADAVAADERARRDRLDQEARDAKAKADAAANRPKDGRESIRGKDGKAYVRVTKVNPQTGKDEVYYENEAGQRVPPPEEKPPERADPTDMPAPTYVVGDAAKDLAAFDTYLADKVKKGELTTARADQLRENRRKNWEVALGETQGIVNTQKSEADRRGRERGDTMQDQANRRTNATSIANQATSSLMPYMDKMGVGANGADFVAALRYLRDSSQDFVTSTGANAYVPNVTPGPALTTINNASIPAPGSTPAASFLSPTRPNAIGLGNGIVPPVGATATPQPATPPRQGASAVAEPTPGVNPGPARPAIAPPPVPVAPPTPVPDTGGAYAPQMGSVPQGATGNGTIMSPAPQQADGNERLDDILTVRGPDGSQMEMPRHEYNSHPAQGQLRVTNARPAVPPTDGGFVFEPGQRPTPPPMPAGPESNGTQSMMPRSAPFLSMTRGPQQQAAYDPMQSVQALIDDPEWDNEAVRQAFRELYGRDLPMSA